EQGWRLAGPVPGRCVDEPTPVTQIVSMMPAIAPRSADGPPAIGSELRVRAGDAAGVAPALGHRDRAIRRLLWGVAALVTGLSCIPWIVHAWLALQSNAVARANDAPPAAASLPMPDADPATRSSAAGVPLAPPA